LDIMLIGYYSEDRPSHCQMLDVRRNWGEKERYLISLSRFYLTSDSEAVLMFVWQLCEIFLCSKWTYSLVFTIEQWNRFHWIL